MSEIGTLHEDSWVEGSPYAPRYSQKRIRWESAQTDGDLKLVHLQASLVDRCERTGWWLRNSEASGVWSWVVGRGGPWGFASICTILAMIESSHLRG
jgi:hypothetical protein